MSVVPLFLGSRLLSRCLLGFRGSGGAAGLSLEGLGNWGGMGSLKSVAGSVATIAHHLVEHLLLLRGGLALDIIVRHCDKMNLLC